MGAIDVIAVTAFTSFSKGSSLAISSSGTDAVFAGVVFGRWRFRCQSKNARTAKNTTLTPTATPAIAPDDRPSFVG
jgi:hypothetical protein